MTLHLYPTVSADIYHCTFNVVFYGEKIFLCTHGSIKSGKTKHKPRRQYVSKRNRESIFLNRIKNYSDRCNSQSVSLSISLTPALFISLYYLPSACWPLYALEFATSQGLRLQARDSAIKKRPNFRGKNMKKTWP